MPDDPRQRPDFHFEDPLYTTPGLDPALYWWIRFPDAQVAPQPPQPEAPRIPEPPTVLGPLPEPTPIPFPQQQLPQPEHFPPTPAPGISWPPVAFGSHTIYERRKPNRELDKAVLRAGAREGKPFYRACEELGLGGGDSAMEYCDRLVSVEEYDRIRSKAGHKPPESVQELLRRAGRPRSRSASPVQRPASSNTRVPPDALESIFRAPQLPRPRGERLPTSANTLSLRAPPRPRPPVERPATETEPFAPDIFEIMRRSREAREREKRRREDLFRRGIPPRPTPDEMAPYPVEPFPRRRDFPNRVPSPLEIPQPRFPDPKPIAQPKVPERSPQPPALPLPGVKTRPSRQAPPRSRPAKTAPVRVLTRIGQVAALSILRPILRRRSQQQPVNFSQFTAPFDPVLQPIADPLPTRIADPISADRQISVPTEIPDLTRIQQPALGLTPQGLRQRRRQEECKCEETEEEKEEERERSASNVVAKVKAFSRRMSQNSLDNLRRGF